MYFVSMHSFNSPNQFKDAYLIQFINLESQVQNYALYSFLLLHISRISKAVNYTVAILLV